MLSFKQKINLLYKYFLLLTLSMIFSNVSMSATVSVSLQGVSSSFQQPALYAFTSHTFSRCGASGANGPTLANCVSSYSTASWASNTAYFNMSTQGIQLWTVPKTGTYRIIANGAQGGSGSNSGGYGASMQGDFTLSRGDIIKILVGQTGTGVGDDSSGGGGTFVVTNSNGILVIAGGGAGAGTSACSNKHGSIAEAGNDACPEGCTMGKGGTGGNGGTVTSGCSYMVAAGGGFYSDGQGINTYSQTNGGKAFLSGGTGGTGEYPGGFGGGGASHNHGGKGGGAGGYSGGGGPGGWDSGGGGGSKNNGTNQVNAAGANSGHGHVVITLI